MRARPLILIPPFLPESPAWREKKKRATPRRPSLGAIFQGELFRTTIVTTLLFACSYGVAFGAIQQMPRIVPGLAELQDLARPAQQKIVSEVQLWQEMGGLAGRALLAFLAGAIVGRRRLLRVFQVPGLILLPLVFATAAGASVGAVKWGIFLCGLVTVAQFSFWGNYLPRVYPTHLRGTGESFAANVGGRVIGTSAALLTTPPPPRMPGQQTALAAALVALLVYLVGTIACSQLPEPTSEALPD